MDKVIVSKNKSDVTGARVFDENYSGVFFTKEIS